jgi:hypothetical protein
MDHAGVRGNVRVEMDRCYLLQESVKPGDVGVMRICVHRKVDLHAAIVGIFYSAVKFFDSKVVRKIAQPERFSPYVNGIGTVVYGYPQFFHVAGRCQEFRPLYCYAIWQNFAVPFSVKYAAYGSILLQRIKPQRDIFPLSLTKMEKKL